MAWVCFARWAALSIAVASAGCVADVDFEVRRTHGAGQGTPSAGELALLTWNIEWFQHPERGPHDDVRQFEGARDLLASAEFDLAGLQEIASPARLSELVDSLPDRAVVTSSHAWPQQTALVYRPSQFELVRVGAVRGLDDAGRPPLRAELVTADGDPLLVVVVHAKAGTDAASHARRERFAAGLQQHLDERRPRTPVIVLGDFNDRFTGSIVVGAPSPYAAFVRGARYVAPTASLEAGEEASTAWGTTLDHIVLSHDLAARVRPGSADVLRDEATAREPAFFSQVSDHAPVVLRLGLR